MPRDVKKRKCSIVVDELQLVVIIILEIIINYFDFRAFDLQPILTFLLFNDLSSNSNFTIPVASDLLNKKVYTRNLYYIMQYTQQNEISGFYIYAGFHNRLVFIYWTIHVQLFKAPISHY